MGIIQRIKSDPKWKKRAHWLIASPFRARPRWYIRWFINPIYHKRGKYSLVRWSARIDVFFFKRFDVGNYSTIEDYCVINNGAGDVVIGDNCRVGIGTVILGPVSMGNGSGTGQHVFIGGFNHGYKDGSKNSKHQSLDVRGVIIEEEAHIGANSVVLAGVTIGKRSQIGAGSVVTKDIPPFSIAAGNPCKIIKQYNHNTGEWDRV
jgi:acetyltransferase-like isoleucine patch superfamily enzyme